MNAYTKFGQILSIRSQDIELKQQCSGKSNAITLHQFAKK